MEIYVNNYLLLSGDMVVKEDQTRRLQDPLSDPDIDEFAPNKDIQFGYHRTSGKQIRITSNGLGAEKMDPDGLPYDGVVYGALPLKGLAEFEVKMVSYGAHWLTTLQLGVMRYKKGVPIESSPSIPGNSYKAKYHYMWAGQTFINNLITPGEQTNYGYVNLKDLCEGDCVGLHLSQDGVLEYFVNGESQGIAAKNIYTKDTDVYAVVDHCGHCVATVITKAGECKPI